jgi:hypothetical protein
MVWETDCVRCRQQEWAADIGEQLDPDKHTIVLCHHGMRSNMVRASFQHRAVPWCIRRAQHPLLGLRCASKPRQLQAGWLRYGPVWRHIMCSSSMAIERVVTCAGGQLSDVIAGLQQRQQRGRRH